MTNLPPCPRCDRPIHDQAYLCGGCGDRLSRDLADVAKIAGEAWTTIARQAANGAHHGRSAEKPLPFSWEAADATDSGANTLTTWARHIAEERGTVLTVPAGQHPLARVAGWLGAREQLDWLRHRPEADEAFDELTDACQLLVRTVDRPPVRWYAGPCDGCTLDLYAMPGANTARCRECGTAHDAQARKAWLLDQADALLATATLVARALTALGHRVTPEAVRKWAERGRIVAHGIDHRGHPTYRVGEVRALAESADRRTPAEVA